MAANYDVDFEFFSRPTIENFKPDGYVPACTAAMVKNKATGCKGKHVEGSPIGISGVTVGTGVDLGQIDELQLRKYKLPDTLSKTLKPYLGKKGIAYFKTHPLKLSVTEAKLLSDRTKDLIFTHIGNNYNDDSDKQFASLSKDVQTAVCCYFYQYGQSAMYESPHNTYWKFITDNDWENAVNYLLNQKAYPTRRKEEAELIIRSKEYEQILAKNALNSRGRV